MNPRPARVTAAGVHLAASLLIGAAAALLVFGLWYPWPWREISGGRDLFVLLVSVDVVVGPLITLVVFNPGKRVRELATDLALVGLLQLAALGYGLWTVAAARPVHLVFEIDRLRIVHAIDVPTPLLGRQPPGIDAMPLTGPTLLAVRPFRDDAERADVTMAALQGLHIGTRPDLWMPYADARARVLAAARPGPTLLQRFPARKAEIDAALARAGRTPQAVVYLPLAGRKSFWTALLDPANGEPVGYLPLDSF